MKRVKLISDGRYHGTQLVDADTGADLGLPVRSVRLDVRAGQMVSAAVDMYVEEVDAVTEVAVDAPTVAEARQLVLQADVDKLRHQLRMLERRVGGGLVALGEETLYAGQDRLDRVANAHARQLGALQATVDALGVAEAAEACPTCDGAGEVAGCGSAVAGPCPACKLGGLVDS